MDVASDRFAELIGPPLELDGPAPVLVGCVRLAARPESVSAARRITAEALKSGGVVEERREDVELVVSEFVTNAVVHGATSSDLYVLLVLWRSGPKLTVKVYDPGTQIGPRAQPDGDAESGRGLIIVDALAERWGASASLDGKCLWAELDVGAKLPDGPEA